MYLFFNKTFKYWIALFFVLLFSFLIINNSTSLHSATSKELEEKKEELEQQIEQLTKEAEKLDKEAQRQKQAGNQYKSQISSLNSEINKIQSDINKNELDLDKTKEDISQAENNLQELQNKQNYYIALLKILLADYAKQSNTSFMEVVLLNETFSDVFDQLQHQEALNSALSETVESVSLLKKDILVQQEELEEQAEKQILTIKTQASQQYTLASKRTEHKNLLNRAIENEKAATRAASDIRKSIEEVRKQVYTLGNAGGGAEEGDVRAINSFGDAYDIAKNVEKLTGVRPAFLLALLKNESSWGASLGNCYVKKPIEYHTNPSGRKTIIGMTKSGNVTNATKRLMRERDWTEFVKITSELGKDPYKTLVSCPHRDYGTGGAMGPAQFIPSTWAGYKERASRMLGRPANPWRVYDAFVVSAIKLANDGAKTQTYDGEWKAAMRYYAGGGWNNPAYAFYGNRVMSLAKEYQADIDVLEDN